MTLDLLLVLAAAIFAIGVYGALSQQSFVMMLMGLELMINAAILAATAFWAATTGGSPKGQMLVIVSMTVMAIEMALGFAVITNVYRNRGADITEKLKKLKL